MMDYVNIKGFALGMSEHEVNTRVLIQPSHCAITAPPQPHFNNSFFPSVMFWPEHLYTINFLIYGLVQFLVLIR